MINPRIFNAIADVLNAGAGIDRTMIIAIEEAGGDPASIVPMVAEILRGYAVLRVDTQHKIVLAGIEAKLAERQGDDE